MAHIEQSSTSDGTSKNNDSLAKFIKVQNNTTSNDDDHHTNETRLNDSTSQFDFNFSESSLSFELSLPTETTTTFNKSQIIPFPAKAVTTASSSSSSTTIIDLTPPPSSSSSSSIATTSQEPVAPPSFSVMIPIPPASVVVDRNTIETTSTTLAKLQSAEPLPEYSAVVEDRPPKYNLSKNIDPFSILGPIHPQQPWPVTKRLYIYGYLIWPLWIIGILWFFAADKTKRQWARRCTFNGLIALMILVYVIVAGFKTGGRFG